MRQVVYISTVKTGCARSTFDEVERQSLQRNANDGLSGLLLFDGVRFLQVIEGPEAAVEATLKRIRRDPRHFGFVTLADKQVSARSFGGWAMLCRDVAPGDTTLTELLRPFLADADRNLRASLQGFAQVGDMRRAA